MAVNSLGEITTLSGTKGEIYNDFGLIDGVIVSNPTICLTKYFNLITSEVQLEITKDLKLDTYGELRIDNFIKIKEFRPITIKVYYQQSLISNQIFKHEIFPNGALIINICDGDKSILKKDTFIDLFGFYFNV